MVFNKIIRSTGFKIAAIVFCITVTALTLDQYVQLIQHLINIKYDWRFELFIVTGMLFFQYPFIFKHSWLVKLDYYFNMVLVSFVGSLLLFPLLAVNYYSDFNDTFNILYFFAVVLVMFFDHKRRVAKLNLPIWLTYSWILYRIIILIFILT